MILGFKLQQYYLSRWKASVLFIVKSFWLWVHCLSKLHIVCLTINTR